eukprot:320588-Ditylum_brightwellii.AAC.1
MELDILNKEIKDIIKHTETMEKVYESEKLKVKKLQKVTDSLIQPSSLKDELEQLADQTKQKESKNKELEHWTATFDEQQDLWFQEQEAKRNKKN